jgi:hypothetical protein
MGQWRSRVEQRRLRVYGPSEAEAREIARQELESLISDRQIDFLIKRSIDVDPLPEDDGTQRNYVNLRRMFNAIRDYRRERTKAA